MVPVGQRVEYPWAGAPDSSTEVQKILSERCAGCHDETTNGDGPQTYYSLTMTDEAGGTTSYELPRLDLSDRPITVTYDNDVATYPASYVSIFYPAALAMEMGMGGVSVEGDVPPAWGVPSDARGSALIEKLNVTSAFDEEKTAWPLGEPFTDAEIAGGVRTMHPEDVNGTLTREERTALIRAFDMGGQYYSRQNTDFSPDDSNALSSGGREY
jgi:hypothetical protein